MATSPFEQPEHQGRTLLKSWSSSLLLHCVLFLTLLYWFGSPESGLGNRDGSLMNFNKVGLEIKTEQSDQFEQQPSETVTENDVTDPSEQTTLETPAEENPFDSLPSELMVEPLADQEPILGTGLPDSIDSSLSQPSGSISDSVLQSATGNLPPQATAPLGVGESSFLGIRSEGENVVFLLDRSGSMNTKFVGTRLQPFTVAKAELKRSLNQLSSSHKFQVIFYHDRAWALASREDVVTGIRMLPVSELNMNLAHNFIDQMRASLGTDHRKALELALSLHPDVIYFLTDADTKLSTSYLRQLRRMSQNTIINCVEFGKGAQMAGTGTHERNFLQRLASDTGGTYRYFDITEW